MSATDFMTTCKGWRTGRVAPIRSGGSPTWGWVSTGFDYQPMHDLTVYDSRLRGTDMHNATPLFYLVRRGSGRGSGSSREERS